MKNRTFAEKLQATIESDPALTEAGLAVKAGLNNSTIRGLLSGRVQSPNLDTAMKICAALGTTLEEFMGNAKNDAEQDILHLISRMPEELRAKLLGYGEGLLAAQDQGNQQSPANDRPKADP